MPRLLIALTFILCSTALAEKLQRPTGFLGVPFGAAPAEVVRVLIAAGADVNAEHVRGPRGGGGQEGGRGGPCVGRVRVGRVCRSGACCASESR